MRILLIEDDEVIAQSLAKSLRNQHYAVDIAKDGQEGWDFADLFTYDLILLDVLLPKLDGISLCRRLRASGNQTPILLLTAQDTSKTKVIGLDAGADDYVAKPFDFQELLARIRALLRRSGSALPPVLHWKNLQLDPSTCEVSCNGKLLHLTPKEYGLLELFLRNNHRIFSCSALIDHLWSFEEPPTEDTVRSHMKSLRQKLKAVGLGEDPVETVYGIGYRLKPAEKEDAATRGGGDTGNVNKSFSASERLNLSESVSTNQNPVSTGISKVWEEVVHKLEERVVAIGQASTILLQGKLSEEMQSQAKLEAHKLVGSLGMFGSDEGSRLAQEIESLLEKGNQLKPATKQHLMQLVLALRQELQLLNFRYKPGLLSVNQLANERPSLLIVEHDREFAQMLVRETKNWDTRVRLAHATRTQIAPNAIAAKELLTQDCPDVVLLELPSDENAENALALLAELSNRIPAVPVIIMTEQNSLLDRVKVARLGGRAVLQKPISPTTVLETVHQILQYSLPTEAKVMVVDDDPQILAAVQTLLVPWGVKVYTLDNPLRFLEAIAVAEPELLILDVEMPGISGIELCQVVRNEPRWSGLPILFLTGHSDTITKQQIFAAGADDYISKPIVEPELITRILNRLERSLAQRHLAEIDALTFVSNRRKSTQDIERQLAWSDRHHQSFCFAIVDLDNLKQINHQHGHMIGDRVLSRLGQLLRQVFHTQDVVGRWGGTEFVVGMAGMNKSDGVRRLLEVLKSFRQIEFTTANAQKFHATFSAAVIEYPQAGNNLQALYQSADTVLEQAKITGRNKVLSNYKY
ncbi:response regulator [Chlorogloeopsis sp. ULAP01]|uniref:response regulator n=1 Tax=Chlorogloeopsis sp. ULAP01 TaxID=3056483 RepID=UPI0025AB564C|nr:response regulator [Chlorogloeopsis sp. ULAP01]MDM9382110.1 response regulator [Chlorogloeopsis sp. ULAP01]